MSKILFGKEVLNMDFKNYMAIPGEKPLDNIVTNGGFCGIFRKIGCIGDSLSSGEFESLKGEAKGYHDYFDYSWGQYIARDAGCTVYNFSRGGMSAKEYCTEFAELQDFWNCERRCQAYIIALGVNDVYAADRGEIELGSTADADVNDWRNNKETIIGYYAQIIQRYKEIQPKARFFLMTMPRDVVTPESVNTLMDKHAEELYKLADMFEYCYVIDLRRYAPLYDEEFDKNFRLGGHLNAAGYRLTALMVESYIDYIIRNNPKDFTQIGFVGTPFFNDSEKW